MLSYIVILAAALATVFWSADRLLIAAVTLSQRYRIPPLIIGIVIIGFGTSSPELAVSVLAALENEPLIAIGNALGSNIANLGLVVGSAALLNGMAHQPRYARAPFPIGDGNSSAGVCAQRQLLPEQDRCCRDVVRARSDPVRTRALVITARRTPCRRR